MEAAPPGRPEPALPPERPNRERSVLLSAEGKLLGPELSRIRSELALPLEHPELPPELPPGYLSRHRRSLPALPPAPGPPTPAELRSSSDVLCVGRFPAGLSRLVPGMRSPVSPRRRGGAAADGGRGGARGARV